MSATSDIESEDLENVPLVRMEDVQPDRYEEVRSDSRTIIYGVVVKDEVLETCVVDSVSSDYVVDQEDGDLLVSMQRVDDEDQEVILPDKSKLDEPTEYEKAETKPSIEQSKPDIRGSWPTLEILPGGVIKHAYPSDNELDTMDTQWIVDKNQKGRREMVYVCAKCSLNFKCLFCLSKHVKWHKDHICDPQGNNSLSHTIENFVCTSKHHTSKKRIGTKVRSKNKTPKKS